MAQYRVRHGFVKRRGMDQYRVWPGSVARMRHGSVEDGVWLNKGAVWLSSGCSVVQ